MSIQTKKKSTVGIAIAAVGAAAITLGAGTFAFFSSTVAGPDTTAAAGTVVLTGTNTGSFNLTGLVPGGASTTNTLSYTVGGSGTSLSLALAVTSTENGCNGDELTYDADCASLASGGDLSGLLRVAVTKSVNDGAAAPVYSGAVSGLPAINNTSGLAVGNTVVYTFVYSFPDGGAGDNAAQGDGSSVAATATLSS
ncbi:MAG: TasA family protein [Pseudonocardiaceae bacterium]